MKKIVENFIELVKIPTHSREERMIADVLKAKLLELGLEVYEDNTGTVIGGNAGNIIARLRGDSDIAPLIFSAHMDRVANNGTIHPVVDEDKRIIRSDGSSILAADNVAGICVILEALRTIKSNNITHGDIEVILSVCEEDAVSGSRHLDYSKIKSNMALVFDISGRIGKIVNQAPSKCKITYRIHGKSAHAGNEPEKGINAIKIAADMIMQLPDGRISAFTTGNISTIHGGGRTTNTVCDYVEILAEIRSIDQTEFARVLGECRQIVKNVADKYSIRIDYDENIFYNTFRIENDEQILQILNQTMQALAIEAKIVNGGGGMDANRFNEHGIKAVGVAPGYLCNHTNEEHVYIDDMLKCAAVAVKFVEFLAEKH